MADDKQGKQSDVHTGQYDARLRSDEVAGTAKNAINPLKTVAAGFASTSITLTIIWLFTKGHNFFVTLDNDHAEVFGEHPFDARVTQLTTTTRNGEITTRRTLTPWKNYPNTDTPAAPIARRMGRSRRVKWNPIVMTLIGESVAESIGKYWHEYFNQRMPSVLAGDNHFPRTKLYNLAMLGKPSIGYYICLSDDQTHVYEQCHETNSTPFYQVIEAFQETRPDVVVVHDQSWAQGVKLHNWKDTLPTHYEKLLAFNFMLHDAVKNKVESLFFLTVSLSDRKPTNKYFMEMEVLLKVIDMLSCSKDHESSIRVTVVDWAKLTCPALDKGATGCEKGAYGFQEILPDGTHPTGESGEYLSRILLSLIMGDIAQNHLPSTAGHFKAWDKAMQNPISNDLLKLAPPPPGTKLKTWSRNLLTPFYLCPNLNVGKFRADFNNRTFAKYTSYQKYRSSHSPQ